MTLRKFTAALAASVLLLVAVSARADVVRLVADSTIKAAGGQINGQIASESPTEVKIKPTVGPEQTIPVDQIAEISYDGLPPSYALAESRLNAGQLAEAAELFQKAVGEARGKPLVERSAQFRHASTLAELGQVDPARADEARAALDAFVKANANSRQVGPALIALTRLSLANGDTTRADAAIADLDTRVPSMAGRTAVLRARVQAKKGENDAAITALDTLLQNADKNSAQYREATLAKAESLAALKKFDEAETLLQQVIAEADPEAADIQAVAHNTLGDCLVAAGRTKDALLAYLKTDVLYASARDQHARALAQIAQLWTDLKQDGRATEVRERLKQLYPQSPYAKGV